MLNKLKILMIVSLSMMVIPSMSLAQQMPLGENSFSEVIDELTDEKTQLLIYSSVKPGLYNKPVRMVLTCDKDITYIYFSRGGYVFTSTEGSYRDPYRTTYRLDSFPAKSYNTFATARTTGPKSGDISLIKSLFNHNTLKVGLKTSSGTFTHTFNIFNLEDAVKPVREACGW